MKTKINLITSLVVLCVLLKCSYIGAQTFINPIDAVPDPFITYSNGYYYLTGTTGSNVCLKKATTLEALKSTPFVSVFSQAQGGPCCDYWAPELHKINGIWYMYYTAAETSGSGQRTWVIENSSADPMSGTWVNRGRIYDAYADYWAIDGTVLSLNGVNYFIWSGVANASDGDKPQRIYIAQMSNPWTLVPGRTLLSSPTLSWENNGQVNEAPEVIRKNGKVFLVYSANGCWTPDYRLGMLYMNESSDPLNAGSWTKYPNAVFDKNPDFQAYGPGHHCFFKSPDGSEDWIAYHAVTLSGGACDNNRTTRAKRIVWNTDGMPEFGKPGITGIRKKAPSGEPSILTTSPLANGTYRIVIKKSQKLIQIAGCSPDVGSNVHQWEASAGGSVCEEWNIQAAENGIYKITAAKGGLSWDVDNCSSDNGANVKMYTPNGEDCQKWAITSVGDGYYKIISKKSGKSLDVASGSTNNGANIQQWDYANVDQQHFRFDLVSGTESINGTYLLKNRYSGLYLDMDDSHIYEDGANAQQWTKTGNTNQQFAFTDLGGGVYKVICVKSGKALDISGVSIASGANVHQWSYVGGGNQQFIVQPTGDGYFKLIAKHSGKLIEVAGFSSQAGANIQQWTDLEQASGQWELEPVVGIPNGTCLIQNRHSGLYLELDANLINQDGANAQQWQLANTTNQQFTIANLGGDLYSIISVASGKSLDVSGASTANGANVQQWSYVAVPQQQFNIVPVDGAYYKIIASHSNKLLEVAGFSTSNGGNIQQWEDAGQLSGHWQFISASGLKSAEELDRIDEGLTLYPNPVGDILSLSGISAKRNISIFTVTGQVLLQTLSSDESMVQIDVSNFNPGVYFVKVEGVSEIAKFLKF
ncbi:MAG: RICIN domain-containing protein [Bacteroidales bacterium]|nr:RICIN domain-containing protein [Bacteroidales bacterium]